MRTRWEYYAKGLTQVLPKIAAAGAYGKAQVDGGSVGVAVAGDWGHALSGTGGVSVVSSEGLAEAGSHGVAIAWGGGMATAGFNGTAITLGVGEAIAGHGGTAWTGYLGTAQAGVGGRIFAEWYDRSANRYRTAVGYIGEDGLQPDTAYFWDSRKGKFVSLESVPAPEMGIQT